MILQLPHTLAHKLEEVLVTKQGVSVKITKFQALSGGCINQAGKITTSAGDFFVKWNDRIKYPEMLMHEASGLRLLSDSTSLHIPGVIASIECDSLQFLVLDFVESSHRRKNFWEELGNGLAQLHRHQADLFGLSHSNYIGSLQQSNEQNKSWIDFFVSERLERLVKLAVENHRADASLMRLFELLYARLPSYIVEEKPALIHGDLWSGNIMVNESGAPTLIDPAVYYGSREMDLAMSRLFGGFDEEFYGVYMDCFPLAEGYEDRFEIYNLYPLLVHLILFGSAYRTQIDQILRKFVA